MVSVLFFLLSAESWAQRSATIDGSVLYEEPLRYVGSTHITITKLNVVRYGIQLVRDRSESDGPSLAAIGIIPALGTATPAVGEPSPEEGAAQSVVRAQAVATLSMNIRGTQPGVTSERLIDEVDQRVEALRAEVDNLSLGIQETLKKAQELRKAHSDALEGAQHLARISDGLLRSSDGAARLSSRSIDLADKLLDILRLELPRATPHYREIAAAKTKAADIMLLEGFGSWYRTFPNSRTWDNLTARLNSLVTNLALLDAGSAFRKELTEVRQQISRWSVSLGSVTEESFERGVEVNCGYPFWKSREHTIQLQTVDLLESDPAKAARKQAVAHVTCPSVLLVSGGLGVGGIDEEVFGFVETADGNGGLKSTIGVESSGSESIHGLLLGHVRLGALGKKERHAWYASTGTLVNIGDAETKFGYILGVSFSLSRSMLLTLGAEARRTEELSGGFSVDDDVPAGLAAPPTRKEWSFDGVLGITFSIR